MQILRNTFIIKRKQDETAHRTARNTINDAVKIQSSLSLQAGSETNTVKFVVAGLAGRPQLMTA